jgi:hypothetical protein
VQAYAVRNSDIPALAYRDDRFVLATDCEKVLDAGFTGTDIRAGDLMSVNLHFKDEGTATQGVFSRLADRIHIALHSDSDSGCQVFE